MSTQSPSTTQLSDFHDGASEDAGTDVDRDYDWAHLTSAIGPASTPFVLRDLTQNTTLPECGNCGETVTRRYARARGDQNDDVHECPNCPDSTERRRYDGSTAGLEVRDRGLGGVVQ
jgi:predicted RNA-binding Zn-ribbon protein involved in translation (DUF1610 family)